MALRTRSWIDANAPSIEPDSALQGDGREPNRPRRRLGDWLSTVVDAEASELAQTDRDANIESASDTRETESRLVQRRLGRDANEPVEAAVNDSIAPMRPSRLDLLVSAIQTNPSDVSALADLAQELRERGMVQESLAIHSRLAELNSSAGAAPLAERRIEVKHGSPARSRRDATLSALTTTVTDFPLADLGFTIPLPGEEDLPANARDAVAQSAEELANGQLMAAFDSCVIAIEHAPDFIPIHLRLAEIFAGQRSVRRARIQAQAMLRFTEVTGDEGGSWMAKRVLLHASRSDLDALASLVDSLIAAKRVGEAGRYGAALIEVLLELGETDDAVALSDRLCAVAPADERIALGHVNLLVRNGDHDGAKRHWTLAVDAGADRSVAAASIAAMLGANEEVDHWRLLGEAVRKMGETGKVSISQAYERTADAMTTEPVHIAGRAVLRYVRGEPKAETSLVDAMLSPSASEMSRAIVAVAVTRRVESPHRLDALEIAIAALQPPAELDPTVWNSLDGGAPKIEDLETDLGEMLLARGDAAGAIDVLKRARARNPRNEGASQRLAESYFQAGQLGAGLAVLDELALSLRADGHLDEMSRVLQQMSALAPKNVKVKTRLIESYLQRGFVEEARVELLVRAELHEEAGEVLKAATSLQRAADLSWGLNKHDESFDIYRRVIALSPDDAGNRSALVNLYLQDGRISEAAEHQRAVVDIAVRKGCRHEAIAALHQVIGLTPDDASAYYQLGDLLDEMGEHQQAAKVFKRLSSMHPDDQVARAKSGQATPLKQTAKKSEK